MGAAAAQATPPTPAPVGSTQTSTTGQTLDGSDHLKKTGLATASPRSGDTPQRIGGVEAAPGAPAVAEMSSLCPTGQKFGRDYATESFETSLPDPGNSVGWDRVTGGTAADGVAWAKSVVTAPEQDADHYLYGVDAPIPTSGKVYAYFAYKSNATGDNAVVVIGDKGFSLFPATEWTYVILDVSSEVAAYPGHMFVDFDHTDLGVVSDETFEVDDVGVYSCVAIPNAGVRGDWTGEGTVDLLGIHTNGNLYLYPGLGNGRTGSARTIGSGWNAFTWTGSPGDVTGDRRTDLVGRKSDGTLQLYAGRGDGGFASAKQIGTGWQGFTAMATPGDMDLDGRPDLLARDAAGAQQLYRFTSTGGLQKVKQIGTGWNGSAWIIGMGDLNGDRRGDIVSVRSGDGCIYAYNTTSALGLSSARKLGCGWGGMNWLTSPGDLTGDRLGDLVARATNGDLYMYPGRPGGGTGSGKKIGTGWGAMASIL
jgi:hypothetical protein